MKLLQILKLSILMIACAGVETVQALTKDGKGNPYLKKNVPKQTMRGTSRFTYGPRGVDRLKITVNSNDNGTAVVVVMPYDENGKPMENGYEFFTVKNGVSIETNNKASSQQERKAPVSGDYSETEKYESAKTKFSTRKLNS